MKLLTVKKRESSSLVLQQWVSFVFQAQSQQELSEYGDKLFRQGLINPSFIEVLEASLSSAKATKNEAIEEILLLINSSVNTKYTIDQKSSTAAVTGGDSSSSDGTSYNEFELAGMILQTLLSEHTGNVPRMVLDAKEKCRSGLITPTFLRVLEDNITACTQAGYNNKKKVLEYLHGIVTTEFQVLTSIAEAADRKKSRGGSGDDDDGSVATGEEQADVSEFYTIHAPKFIDTNAKGDSVPLTVLRVKSFINGASFSGSAAVLAGTATGVNNKKKSEKSTAKKQVGSLADKVSDHLNEFGWAVCDSFLPTDLVKRVRIEACLFQQHFEQSEIWVGKESDIGAQLSVPSVRGDKVLWMCGGHMENQRLYKDGISQRPVRSVGEIEPCKLEIKAQAPIRKFNAIKDALAAVDTLVSSLKDRMPQMTGVYGMRMLVMVFYM